MSTSTPDRRLAALQREQRGVFAVTQAVQLGMREATLHARVAAGRYERLWPGVLRTTAVHRDWEARAQAALLHVGGEAALARESAARVLGLSVPRGPDTIHLVVRDRVFPAASGLTVHRTRQLPHSDVTTASGLRLTTGVRTVADLGATLGPVAMRRLLKSAVREDLVTATDLRAHLRRRGRLRGKRAILALLDELSPLEAACRNEFESCFLALMRGAGLEPTAMNHPVVDARGRQREIDAVWLPEHLPVELHSRRWHGSDLDAADDLGRENDIVLAGPWRTFLRFSWHDVTTRGDEVIARVRAALDAARTATAPATTSNE